VKSICKLILFLLFLSSADNLLGGKELYYKVKKGDSLYKISKNFLGAGIKWTNIYRLNSDIINDPDLIYPAQKLVLKGIPYKIKKGDSLYKISKNIYGDPLLWKKIYVINSNIIKNPELIYPDQTIILPELKKNSIEPPLLLPPSIETNMIKPVIAKSNIVKTDIIKTNIPSTNVIAEKKSEESIEKISEILNQIPFSEDYIPDKVFINRKAEREEIESFLPSQLSPNDFAEVEVIAGTRLKQKTQKDNILYITVCDFKTLEEKEMFWNKIKTKITNTKNTNAKIQSIGTNGKEGFTYEIAPDIFAFLKKKIPHIITIIKAKLEYKDEVSAFTEMFLYNKVGILKNKKIKDEIFLLPAYLPAGLKFRQLYLEKIPPEYVSEKIKSEWAKKMVGKINVSAVYVDDYNVEWTINLFNLENEQEAKVIYDNLYSRPKQEILDKIKASEKKSSKGVKVLKSILEMSGDFEPIQIGSYKGWLVENRMKNICELNFRASYYLIAITVSKLGQKDILIELAESLQIDKIIVNTKNK